MNWSNQKSFGGSWSKTEIVSPKPDKVKGWNFTDWGSEFKVDKQITKADADQYDALMLPGGALDKTGRTKMEVDVSLPG